MTEPKNEKSKMLRREDAIERFQRWKDEDPYPHILPALLNSADIHDYIETTGMVYPYDPRLMKSSSYEARIGDFAYFWDENGDRKDITLGENSTVELAPNSLVFFKTKEAFRLPSYMAIRFNLRITNVHRGLLLGTGPLVDPGFEGKLLIPIHNLTNNTYYFCGDVPFIWIEFTKISRNDIWHQESQITVSQRGVYEPFPEEKKDLKPPAYFEKANRGNRIQNAVPEALYVAEKIANAAKAQAEKAAVSANAADTTVRNYGKAFTVSGAAAILVAAAGVYFGVSPLITGSTSLSKDVSSTILEFRKEYREHLAKEHSSQAKIEALEGKISDIKLGDDTRDKVIRQQTQLDALEKQIGALQNELNRYKALQSPPNPPRQ